MIRKVSLFGIALALFLAPTALSAQNAMITGTVRSQTLAPVRGAYVAIPSLEVSTLTNDAGIYRLVIPAERATGQQATMVIRQIGYQEQEITVTVSPGLVRQDVTLHEQAIALDGVVVTGTAGRQEVRAQAAQVANVDAADIVATAPVASVSNLLQSRTPGVSLQATSGTSGTAQTIRLRGAASISLSNEPLVFIDGVRADSRTEQVYGVGGQAGSRLNDIRPEDIESIEVVKGPAAATLYGADASAGVIHIITKKGRPGGGFTQSITAEYNLIDQGFEGFDNYAVCTQARINAGYPVCQGLSAGSVVHDNPLKRYNVFDTGTMRSLSYSGRGGGENYGFFVSLADDVEDGTLPNNKYNRRNARFAFDFIPHEDLRVEASLGLIKTFTRLPRNDNDIYGWLGGGALGSPLTVGLAADGWYAANRQTDAIASYENTNDTFRTLPRLAINYSPVSWFTNRLIVGADMTRTEAAAFFPRNDQGWYDSGDLNSGQISEARRHRDQYTVDYLGNISTALTEDLDSDLSFGMQIVATRSDLTNATGITLATNDARAINAAATRTGGQSFSESRTVGFLAQWQLSFRDRLYLQVAGRLDQASAFGTDADPFFSPKVGVSYVVSDEPAVRDILPEAISAMRLRASYGTTGRSPTSGVIMTYSTTPYAISSGAIGGGMVPQNPGNPDLRPERGTEFEAGLEAGLFNDRLGLDVTFFNKVTNDLILSRPLAPSMGWTANPVVNIGQVVNRGFEVAADLALVTQPNFAWTARLGLSTLHNEITDMGDVAPFGTLYRRREGAQIGAFHSYKIKGYEEYTTPSGETATRAIVSDTLEFLGNLMPTNEGVLSTTMNFFGDLQLYAQLDWKRDFYIYNNTKQFRERQMGTDYSSVHRDEVYTAEERAARFGPFINESGAGVSATNVYDAYVEPGDFVRLREVSLTYTLPVAVSDMLRASRASVTLGGRNLALWTDYSGLDPEVNSSSGAFAREDFLTLPSPRRWMARFNIQF